MKRYTPDDLATIVQQLIRSQFDSPKKILSAFSSDIKRKVKSLTPKKLTDDEIDASSSKVAASIFQDLDRITKDIILSKLSNEVSSKSFGEGIELPKYKDYFMEFSHEMVKGLLQAKFKSVKKQSKKTKK